MTKWNRTDPYNLDYIKEQVQAIKTKHPELGKKETEKKEDRPIEELLEQQLTLLEQIHHTLERIEKATLKKGWKNIFK